MRDLNATLSCVKYKDSFLHMYGYMFCEVCFRSNKFPLEVHHLFFRSEKPKHPLLNNECNLILVCRDCHNKLHSKKHFREELPKFNEAKKIFKKK